VNWRHTAETDSQPYYTAGLFECKGEDTEHKHKAETKREQTEPQLEETIQLF